ncbi:hypothetical protein [Pedobacter sandarakinus]|uniref:hypothetical protein n=1 Tax=Pedobacter sandarakinus TaxID=353156 RepID=UPI002245F1A1|nr:hypothetical protein [Pedobacter sandarakinus]MCX2574077.1 hypothetical protein [Pedobacter sandarakinus]
MSNFFLLNAAIDIPTYNEFKLGMSELIAIDKKKDHVFLKHQSIYNLNIFEELFRTYGPVESAIIIFLEQHIASEVYVDTEEKARELDTSLPFAFTGINFLNQAIALQKQIVDDTSYQNFCRTLLGNLDKLKDIMGECLVSKQFEKMFADFKPDVQQSIIEDFAKAKARGLKTPFYPDTKIIKDVTKTNHKTKVYELRVYTPIALRVYFNEIDGVVKLASIEQKSNPNQDNDINSAHKILNEL